jgi:2,4-dienoyl-CoA reductase-like NADH-dependent reductase (Old Yellow Enzyme family)
MSKLFSSFRIKDITFRNRIVVSPMCQYSAVDGFANDWHLVHLGSRAVGGAALVISEAVSISPEGRISPEDLGIWKEDHLEKLRQITTFIKDQGAIAGIQLAHAGRKASTYTSWKGSGQLPEEEGGWQTVAPSSIGFYPDDRLPLALDKAGIEKVIADFAEAAAKALRAGFEVIEIHAAHGYLVNQFLSPLSNHRSDEYGGNFENRIRLLLEIIEAVKQVWPGDLPFFVRISATDWVEGGWDITDSVQLSKILKANGVDLIDVSTGGIAAHAQIPVGPAYQLPFASQIKKETGILTGAVGMITDALQCESILENQEADLILMAREFLRDPYFPLHAASVVGEDIIWPVQYQRAKPVKKI